WQPSVRIRSGPWGRPVSRWHCPIWTSAGTGPGSRSAHPRPDWAERALHVGPKRTARLGKLDAARFAAESNSAGACESPWGVGTHFWPASRGRSGFGSAATRFGGASGRPGAVLQQAVGDEDLCSDVGGHHGDLMVRQLEAGAELAQG